MKYDSIWFRIQLLKGIIWLPVLLFFIIFFFLLSVLQTKAASIYDNNLEQQSFPYDNSAYALSHDFDYVTNEWWQYGLLEFSTSTNTILCDISFVLYNYDATSGLVSVSLTPTLGGDVFESNVYSASYFPIAQYTTTTFWFDPCMTLVAGDRASFFFQDPAGLNDSGAIAIIGQTTTSTEYTWRSIRYGYNPHNVVLQMSPAFTIGGVDVGNNPDPADYGLVGTSTNPGDFGLFGNFFIGSMTWLFVPNEDALKHLASTTAEITTKVPWGYIPLVQNAILAPSYGLATSTIGIPIPGHATLTVFDPTWWDSNDKGFVWAQNIRTWISWSIALSFLWFLYHRILRMIEHMS